MNKWYINENQLDDVQTQISTQSLEKSIFITGCAGSGKTILALHRAAKIAELEEPYYVIVYTKVLRNFIEDGIRELDLNPDNIMHYHAWKKTAHKNTTHLIVDEAQDFDEEKIDLLFSSFSGSIICFGDQAQTLYDNSMKINKVIGKYEYLIHQNLNKNFRFPKQIARAAKYLQDEDQGEIYVNRCVREGDQKPRLYQFQSNEKQIEYVVKQIKSRKLTDVGILLPSNSQVEEFKNDLQEMNIDCEARYRDNQYNEENTLDFSSNNPKICTYHSSKGCQFNDVFLPFCEDDLIDDFYKNALYVAFTRAINNVYVLYTNKLPKYFNAIPKNLYLSQDEEIVPDF